MSRLGLGTRRGFSLIELIMVMAIMLAVAAIAMPKFVTFVSTYQLKSALNSVAGTLQQTRIIAVRKNKYYQFNYAMPASRQYVFAETVNANSTWDSGEPGGALPSKVTIQTTGFPGNATTTPNFTAQASSVAIQFNSRGLPCIVISSICQNLDTVTTPGTPTPVGFVVYVRNTGVFGVPGWGAVTVTPAGRIQTWVWNGSAYSQQ
jgi:prepilin-type N-terminal cleavage/methylation domain-containing protein